MNFTFLLPITESKSHPVWLGDLQITGRAYPAPDELVGIEYDSIKWQGAELLHFLESIPGADDIMGFIYNASIAHVKYQSEQAEILNQQMRKA